MIKYGIMAVRERAVYVYRLKWELKQQGAVTEILWDDNRDGPRASAERFWNGISREETGCLIQDDVEVPKAFVRNVEGIVKTQDMKRFYCGFLATNIYDRNPWGEEVRWLKGMRIVAPCVIAGGEFIHDEFLPATEERIIQEVKTAKNIKNDERGIRRMADDEWYAIGSWLLDRVPLTTNPSLVQHKNLKSTVGHNTKPRGREIKARIVADRVLDWSAGETVQLKGHQVLNMEKEYGSWVK